MPRKRKKLIDFSKQVAEGYYTAQEAQKRLGMNRDVFNNHVKQGSIQKTVFVGSHGYYKKADIDVLAERIETLIFTATAHDIEYRAATIDDLEAELDLAALNFGRKRAEVTRPARQRFMQVNPQMTHYLFDQRRMVASINFIPFTHEAIAEFRQGKRGWLFMPEQILQFEPGQPLECAIIDMMTTTRVTLDQRHRYAAELLSKFARITLVEWGRQGVDIITVDACAGTEDGERILNRAKFVYQGTKEYSNNGKPDEREMYHFDISESTLKMLQPYKQALAEWRAQH